MLVNESVKETFQLKGSRAYVHGTSIIDSLKRHAKALDLTLNNLDISFRQQILSCDRIWHFNSCEKVISENQAFCSGSFSSNNNEVHFSLTPNTQRVKSSSIPYDETAITSLAVFDDKSISMTISAQYSLIENIVSLTKRYNNTENPLVRGQWLFGRLITEKYIDSSGTIAIKEISKIPGKLIKSEILINNEQFGIIFFTASNP